MTTRPAALVFDAYGTLFDVHSVVALCDELWPGKGAQLSQLWRTSQLQHTWLRSLMGRYEDFAHVTEAALRYACAALALPRARETAATGSGFADRLRAGCGERRRARDPDGGACRP